MNFSLKDPRYTVNYEREIIYDKIGENIALDWIHNKQFENDKQPIVIICPGLTGDSE